ncbi:MAG: hemerythrin domain-containing protein [Burkholderiales bacterium]|nr:hemerythrin domain-containing protein [Burkholderiales bacterium]
MEAESLRIIRDEHRAIASVLRTMNLLLTEHRQRGTPLDFGILRAMLFYLDEYPERLHHPNESNLLFPMVRKRSQEAREILDRLDREHERGEAEIVRLGHLLLGFEMMGESRYDPFETAMKRYTEHYFEHMRTEEVAILPLAQKVLTAEDWREVDAAFAANRDPLTGHRPDEAYRPVIARILNSLPAPYGLGPART